MAKLYYVFDEALKVEREYAEVGGEASVGDYVKYGKRIARVVEDSHGYGETLLLTTKLCDATKLAPTGNVHIDDVIYRLADRKAVVGERVIVTEERMYFSAGDVFDVEYTDFCVSAVGKKSGKNVLEDYYLVLEPTMQSEPAHPAPPADAEQLLANLVRRVASVEKTLGYDQFGPGKLPELSGKVIDHQHAIGEIEEQAEYERKQNDEFAGQMLAKLEALTKEMSAIKNDLQTFAEVAEDAKHQAEVLSKQAQAKRDNDRARALYNRKGGCV